MLFQPRNTKVCRVDKNSNVTLEETLRPLWKFTYYCGISLDWCSPIVNKYRICKLTHYFSVVAIITLLVFMMLFELVQVFETIKLSSNIHGIVTNIIWLVPVPLVLITQINYLHARQKFLDFFEDWKKLERDFVRLSVCDGTICDSQVIHRAMYGLYAGMTLASLISLAFDMRNNPQATYLLSTYEIIRETIPLPVIAAIHLVTILIMWTLMSLGDVVPAFVYYHAALSVSYLERDVKTVFKKRILTEETKDISIIAKKISQNPPYTSLELPKTTLDLDAPIRLLWTRYENVYKMVERANMLFGGILVINQGASLFMTTILLYSVLYNLKDALKTQIAYQLVAYLFNYIAVMFRFISCTLITSHLERSASKLRNSLNYLLGKNWNQITKQDRDLVRSFLSRLQCDPLLACPLGLYNITASTLLTVLGLVVSYVIVLLQSN